MIILEHNNTTTKPITNNYGEWNGGTINISDIFLFDVHIILAEGDSNNFKRTTKQITMEQTAVEFLEKICKDRGYHLMEEYFEQAKAMEKEQIIIARWIGDYSCDSIKAEQYYKETYGGKDL